eukprot:7249344-Pyramimonas_sp.AAC.1
MTHRPPPGQQCGPRSECSVGTCRPPALTVVSFGSDYAPAPLRRPRLQRTSATFGRYPLGGSTGAWAYVALPSLPPGLRLVSETMADAPAPPWAAGGSWSEGSVGPCPVAADPAHGGGTSR